MGRYNVSTSETVSSGPWLLRAFWHLDGKSVSSLRRGAREKRREMECRGGMSINCDTAMRKGELSRSLTLLRSFVSSPQSLSGCSVGGGIAYGRFGQSGDESTIRSYDSGNHFDSRTGISFPSYSASVSAGRFLRMARGNVKFFINDDMNFSSN